jgi:hypothetical protein
VKFFRFFLFSFLITTNLVFAQDDVIFENQVWAGLIVPVKINSKWTVINDVHFIPESFLILRTGLTRNFKTTQKINVSTSLGYSHLWLYPQSNSGPTRNERRPWGQTVLRQNILKAELTHRFRFDARFKQKVVNQELLDEFQFNWRFRYSINLKHPFSVENEKFKKWYWYVSNEILYDFGKNIKNNHRLNQNRISAGIGYQKKDLSVQLGYLNMLKKDPQKSTLTDAHTAMLLVTKGFTFKK